MNMSKIEVFYFAQYFINVQKWLSANVKVWYIIYIFWSKKFVRGVIYSTFVGESSHTSSIFFG